LIIEPIKNVVIIATAQSIWIVIICLVMVFNCFLAKVINKGTIKFITGMKTTSKEERLIKLIKS